MSRDGNAQLAAIVQKVQKDWNIEIPSSGGLYKGEAFWRDHQPWLLERGYKLRARYQPDWTPSWEKAGRKNASGEDSVAPETVHLMDATRVSDGSFVMLKQIAKAYHPYEVEIAQHVSTGSLRADPRNHSVPILDVLEVPDDDSVVILVMPLLRKFDDPPFRTLGEVITCVTQMFEGIQFLHEHNVVHRDCCDVNFMMDATPIFPVPYHPVTTGKTRDFTAKVRPLTRTDRPVKYYWIDFGLSRHYRPEERPPAETIIMGADDTVPEYKEAGKKYDPFPADVYLVGHLVLESLVEKYRNVDVLHSLVKRMVQDDPSKRPTMDQVVTDFKKIVMGLGQSKLNARLVNRQESFIGTIFRDTSHTFRSLFPRSASSNRVGSSQKPGRA